jgi:hypothetical protein
MMAIFLMFSAPSSFAMEDEGEDKGTSQRLNYKQIRASFKKVLTNHKLLMDKDSSSGFGEDFECKELMICEPVSEDLEDLSAVDTPKVGPLRISYKFQNINNNVVYPRAVFEPFFLYKRLCSHPLSLQKHKKIDKVVLRITDQNSVDESGHRNEIFRELLSDERCAFFLNFLRTENFYNNLNPQEDRFGLSKFLTTAAFVLKEVPYVILTANFLSGDHPEFLKRVALAFCLEGLLFEPMKYFMPTMVEKLYKINVRFQEYSQILRDFLLETRGCSASPPQEEWLRDLAEMNLPFVDNFIRNYNLAQNALDYCRKPFERVSNWFSRSFGRNAHDHND